MITPVKTNPHPIRVKNLRCSSKINHPRITVIGALSAKITADRLGPNLFKDAKSAVSPKKMPIIPDNISTLNVFSDNSFHDPVVNEIPASKKKTIDILILLNANAPNFLIGYIEINPEIDQQKAAPNADNSAINIFIIFIELT